MTTSANTSQPEWFTEEIEAAVVAALGILPQTYKQAKLDLASALRQAMLNPEVRVEALVTQQGLVDLVQLLAQRLNRAFADAVTAEQTAQRLRDDLTQVETAHATATQTLQRKLAEQINQSNQVAQALVWTDNRLACMPGLGFRLVDYRSSLTNGTIELEYRRGSQVWFVVFYGDDCTIASEVILPQEVRLHAIGLAAYAGEADVRNAIRLHEMPPGEVDNLTDDERTRIFRAVNLRVEQALSTLLNTNTSQTMSYVEAAEVITVEFHPLFGRAQGDLGRILGIVGHSSEREAIIKRVTSTLAGHSLRDLMRRHNIVFDSGDTDQIPGW